MNDKSSQLEVVSIRLVKDAPLMTGHPVHSPEDAVKLIGKEMCQLDREVVCVLHLKTDGSPISCTFASMGAIDKSIAHPRELIKAAVLSNASNMILLHNHVSGSLEPSTEDVLLTDRMIKVCDLIGIPLMDHVIVAAGTDEYFSFKEKNRLPNSNLRYELKTDYQDIEFSVPVAAETKSEVKNRI
ncbi:MAG: JAB domain-containing protein [Eubacterium sp.]|nr:JAB domain-containing protein [Eubacterium sp.]